MKSYFLFILFLLLGVSGSLAEPIEKLGERMIDSFTKSRWETFNKKEYSPDWSRNAEREALFDLLPKSEWQEFLKGSDKWLKKMPIDIEVHDVRAHVFRLIGDRKSASKSGMIYAGFIASLMSEGDGKTLDSAIEVTSLREVYAIIDDLGLKFISQSLDRKGIETMTCEDSDGGKILLYFDTRKLMAKRAERIKDAQQGGADQPATAPESKSEGNEDPKPESEGRSQ